MVSPDTADAIRVILYPPLPFVRVWFRKVSTRRLVEQLGHAVSTILERQGPFGAGRRLDREHDPVPNEALFVAADEPLLAFASAAAAECALEAVDVRNGVYPAAWDRHGNPYRILVEGEQVIVEKAGDETRRNELEDRLRLYLDALGICPGGSADLEELEARAWTLARPV